MENSKFFINGVYETVISEILESQRLNPNKLFLLQPHSKTFWKQFSPEKLPSTLYITLTSDYDTVTHQCELLSCRNKIDLSEEEIETYNKHLREHQPGELTMTKDQTETDPFTVLLEIKNLAALSIPRPTSYLVKVSNNEPLKHRERAGGHSEVYEAEEWHKVEVMGLKEYLEKSEEDFKHAMNLPYEILERRANERLDAKRKPQKIYIRQQGFIRDGYVRAATLKRANGKCERCKSEAPFISKATKRPYLEVHHKIMLADGGEDTLENTIAVCPNCHRYLHFGI